MRSSIEGIQLSLASAQRLFLDSTKVSSPTAAALFETSLEEYAKAWMLYFSSMKHGVDGVSSELEEIPGSAPTPQDIKKLVAFEKNYHQDLADPPTEDALRKYLLKLRFLRIMLEFEEANLSLYPAIEPYIKEFDLEHRGTEIGLHESRLCPMDDLGTLCNTLEGAIQDILQTVVGENRQTSK